MPLFFLIPLLTCLVTGYIFTSCTDEIGNIAGIFALVSLILSLILAPWQILFFLLVCILLITKKLLQQNENKIKSTENNQERSNYYEQKQTTPSTDNNSMHEVTRKYRGANY